MWLHHINALKGWAEALAIFFMVLTVAMAANQIGLHLTYNQHASFRAYTIRILLLVPIYSITSYAGLHNPSNAVIWALLRDCYHQESGRIFVM